MGKHINTWAVLAGITGGVVAGFQVGSARAADTTETNTPTTQTKAEVRHATAKVASVDRGARTLNIRNEDGEEATVYVPTDVKAFDKIKAGDKIDIDYYQSMAISMAPAGSKPTMSERKGRAVDNGGGITGREVMMSAEVVSVDPAANTVTFKGPKGNVQTVHVTDPANQEKLPTLKPGQVVQFDYKEATAASIRPAGK